MKRQIIHLIILGVILNILQSCASLRADIFLYQNTSKEDKAQLLYNEGLRLYQEELIKKKNLKIVDNAILYFSDAYLLYPGLLKDGDYINTITNIKIEQTTKCLKNIQELYKKDDKSDYEEFLYVLSIKQASDLKVKDKFLEIVKKESKGLFESVKSKTEERLKLELNTFIVSDDPNEMSQYIKSVNQTQNELFQLDPDSRYIEECTKKIEGHINDLTDKNVTVIQNLINEKRFVEAEKIVRRAEAINSLLYSETNSNINRVKYDLFVTWAKDLYKNGKLQLSKNIAVLARDIDNSQDVQLLISQIDKTKNIKDFESTINDVIDSIDYFIQKGDPISAISQVNTNLPKFKLKNNTERIRGKIGEIESIIERLYNDGIRFYNEEDYETAYIKFKTVISYNNEYKDSQAYFDRTENKLKVLKNTF